MEEIHSDHYHFGFVLSNQIFMFVHFANWL